MPPVAPAAPLAPYLTNLWGAYGLSQLVGGAAVAIRVRRSSDNAEQDIGFLFSGALDAATLLSFTGANDAFVTKLYDQSGGGHDIVQATSSKQPKIVDAGTYMAEVTWDGVDDTMASPNSGTPAGFSIYLGGRNRTAPQGSTGAVAYTFVGNVYADNLRDTTYNDGYRKSGGNSTFLNDTDNLSTDQATTYGWVYDPSQSGAARLVVYENGVAQSSINSTGSTTSITALPWNIGSDGAGSGICKVSLTALAIYEAIHSSGTAALVSAAIRPAPKIDGLDGFTTSIYGAYSLRKVLTAYAGNCFQVRRSSDSTALDIGFTAAGVFDAAALLTFVGAGNGFISKWYDQSGNTHDAVQATTTKQPAIVTSGVVLRGITFDGTDDALSPATASGATSGCTCFAKGNSESGSGYFVCLSPTYDTTSGWAMYRSSNQIQYGLGQTGASGFSTLGANINGAGQVLTFRGDRTQTTHATKAVLFSAGTKLTADQDFSNALPTGNFGSQSYGIGGVPTGTAFSLTGDLDTIVIYETAMSDANIDRVSRLIG